MHYFFGFFLFLAFPALSQQMECRDYQNGRFKLIDTKAKMSLIVERNGSRQIETDHISSTRTVFQVRWTSDCEYELNILEGNSEQLNFYKNKTLIVKILERYSDGYRFEVHIKGTRDIKTHFMRFL